MVKKFIILDIETTGIDLDQGHRVIEIGAVILNDRNASTDHFHTYLNPPRLVEENASSVHGITNEYLNDQPLFKEIAEEFLEFVNGSTLVIHKGGLDITFLNNELQLASSKYPKLEDVCEIEDSLIITRNKFYGERNSLVKTLLKIILN
tara:strand:+ start:297 stop:743 length:447 start_codon:yes stop_codon:yes gene_type:complete